MPMSPGKDESQSDFMHRCVPEMMGDGKRKQDQAVAACLSMWREGKKSARDQSLRKSSPTLVVLVDDPVQP